MKTSFQRIIVLTFVLFTFFNYSFAQDAESFEMTATKSAVFEDRVSTFIGQVNLTSDKLKVHDAEKIVYDEKAQTIEIYGSTKIVFDGGIHIPDTSIGKKITKTVYKIGSDMLTVY